MGLEQKFSRIFTKAQFVLIYLAESTKDAKDSTDLHHMVY